MCVLDNGASMDAEGLRELWHIAFSPKKGKPVQYGRRVIGKFGIGKLATYVLANKLTYICKASDGVIRRVTMDYGIIDAQQSHSKDKLISELSLDLYQVEFSEVEEALSKVSDGQTILELIRKGVPQPAEKTSEDEFGGSENKFEPPRNGTWTLVVLSDLKPTGRELKLGILRRMLAAALPFETEMAISVNGELLSSSKIEVPVMAQWTVGPDLEIDFVEIDESDEIAGNETAGSANPKSAGDHQEDVAAKERPLVRISVQSGMTPDPFVDIPEVGRVTGKVRLFSDRISGGKSEERGASNGFHINVLGRLVNQNDPSFGEDNLSHAAWARFRMTVRADGLNESLTTNREQFRELRQLKIFRAFLRKVFNKARTTYDSDQNAEMPHGGDVLVRSLGVLSLNPLRSVVSETLRSKSPLPGLFDETGIKDREEKRRSWREETADNIRNALGEIRYEKLADDSFVKFRLSDNAIVVNKDHPFVLEHSRTRAEKELLRTLAMVSLLTDIYSLDIGVEPKTLESIREYRDRLMRFKALQQRKSGTYIAKLLLQTQHDADYKRLEAVLSDALRYLGFQVKDLAKPGEPEGIAYAYTLPTGKEATTDNPSPPLYSFSFDAKSSKYDSAKTGNLSLDGIVEHRDRYHADHALVVAPGFSGKAVKTRCAQQKVTPMAAKDLGRLLEYTVEYGAIPLTKLRDAFRLFDPDDVNRWVTDLEKSLKKQRPVTIDVFLRALEGLRGKVPDVLAAGLISYECRQKLGAVKATDENILAIAKGLEILVPDLVGVNVDKIVVNASAERVAAAVEAQLEKLHSDEPAEELIFNDSGNHLS